MGAPRVDRDFPLHGPLLSTFNNPAFGTLDPAHLDGKTCNEQKVVLKMDFLPDGVELPLLKALVRVSPYNKTAKGANSGSFKLAE